MFLFGEPQLQLREELGGRREVLGAGQEVETRCSARYLMPRTKYLAPPTLLPSMLIFSKTKAGAA